MILLGIAHLQALTMILKPELVYYAKETQIYLTYRRASARDVAQIMCIAHLSISVLLKLLDYYHFIICNSSILLSVS